MVYTLIYRGGFSYQKFYYLAGSRARKVVCYYCSLPSQDQHLALAICVFSMYYKLLLFIIAEWSVGLFFTFLLLASTSQHQLAIITMEFNFHQHQASTLLKHYTCHFSGNNSQISIIIFLSSFPILILFIMNGEPKPIYSHRNTTLHPHLSLWGHLPLCVVDTVLLAYKRCAELVQSVAPKAERGSEL